jgi:hypothetical protein
VAKPSEIRDQIAQELQRRTRLAVPAFAGGVLYLLSNIVIASVLRGEPRVGVLQGIEPALRGEANPTVSPGAGEVKFISSHALGLIAGGALEAISLLALTAVLLLLLDAARFRRPQVSPRARPLVLYGGIATAVVVIAHLVVIAIQTHNFAVGHDFSTNAVEQARTKGTLNLVTSLLVLLAPLLFAAGMIISSLNAQRVGLFPRWMGVIGIFSAILITPFGQAFGVDLKVVPAFWMVMLGILYSGRWSKGDPPAWEAGEARPWPSGAQLRAERQGQAAPVATASAAADVAPEPTRPSNGRAANRRRRKRRARG